MVSPKTSTDGYTCPDGQVYQVGDNNDDCSSLACAGGTSGTCNKANGAWSNRMVTCAGGAPLRHFLVELGGMLVLEGVRLVNGWAVGEGGGAILAKLGAQVHLTDTIIEDCKATLDGDGGTAVEGCGSGDGSKGQG